MMPSTTVLHSEPAFRIPLTIFGVAFLVLILGASLWQFYQKIKTANLELPVSIVECDSGFVSLVPKEVFFSYEAQGVAH